MPAALDWLKLMDHHNQLHWALLQLCQFLLLCNVPVGFALLRNNHVFFLSTVRRTFANNISSFSRVAAPGELPGRPQSVLSGETRNG